MNIYIYIEKSGILSRDTREFERRNSRGDDGDGGAPWKKEWIRRICVRNTVTRSGGGVEVDVVRYYVEA